MPISSSSTHLSPAELSYLHTSLSSHPPIRPDGRLATDFRPLSAETGVLPNTMGSAHVGFADGREAVVGIRAEVEKTSRIGENGKDNAEDLDMTDGDMATTTKQGGSGQASWVTLTLSLPGLRDDDKDLVFLEEMLREVLVIPSSTTLTEATGLQDALVINKRWHWHLYIDVVLISPPESASGNFPLPLLSMAVHLALRDTRIPRLKSEDEEDPVADDDWDASVFLYARKQNANPKTGQGLTRGVPPVTLLVMVVGENVVFDPSAVELGVADGVLAISVSRTGQEPSELKVLGLRMLESGARDTMKGVPRNESGNTWDVVPGVWKPKVGGLKRNVITKVLKAVVGGTAAEILDGLEGFLNLGA